MRFKKAADKNDEETTVIHLKFEIDFLKMKVQLFQNKSA